MKGDIGMVYHELGEPPSCAVVMLTGALEGTEIIVSKFSEDELSVISVVGFDCMVGGGTSPLAVKTLEFDGVAGDVMSSPVSEAVGDETNEVGLEGLVVDATSFPVVVAVGVGFDSVVGDATSLPVVDAETPGGSLDKGALDQDVGAGVQSPRGEPSSPDLVSSLGGSVGTAGSAAGCFGAGDGVDEYVGNSVIGE